MNNDPWLKWDDKQKREALAKIRGLTLEHIPDSMREKMFPGVPHEQLHPSPCGVWKYPDGTVASLNGLLPNFQDANVMLQTINEAWDLRKLCIRIDGPIITTDGSVFYASFLPKKIGRATSIPEAVAHAFYLAFQEE